MQSVCNVRSFVPVVLEYEYFGYDDPTRGRYLRFRCEFSSMSGLGRSVFNLCEPVVINYTASVRRM